MDRRWRCYPSWRSIERYESYYLYFRAWWGFVNSYWQSSIGGEGACDWHLIASCIPGRTNKDCRKRWHYKVAATVNKGPWEVAEDERLWAAVQEHGSRYVFIFCVFARCRNCTKKPSIIKLTMSSWALVAQVIDRNLSITFKPTLTRWRWLWSELTWVIPM